jgi:hypothetical protein
MEHTVARRLFVSATPFPVAAPASISRATAERVLDGPGKVFVVLPDAELEGQPANGRPFDQ